jgi:hypothetical protein
LKSFSNLNGVELDMFGIFKRKESEKVKGLTLRVWLSSGGFYDFGIDEAVLEKLKSHLSYDWNATKIVARNWGVNFSQVSHYEVLML